MRGVRCGQYGRACRETLLRPALVYVGRCQEPEGRVMVLGVVPGEEDVAVGSGILDRAEALRERRAVLQRLELRLRERVVIRDVRPGMGLGDAEVGQQEADGPGGHRRASVRVDRQLA